MVMKKKGIEFEGACRFELKKNEKKIQQPAAIKGQKKKE
jgi:hypothetical protein